MKRFQAAVKKTFSKVKAFMSGQGSALLENGKRLNLSAQSPRSSIDPASDSLQRSSAEA